MLQEKNNESRFSPQDLTSSLQLLLENLFRVFSLPDSGENEYAMKCVMRVISFVGPQVNCSPCVMNYFISVTSLDPVYFRNLA